MKTAVNSGSKPARIFIVALAMMIGVASISIAQELPPLNRDTILGHLNEAITWYRDTTTKVQAAGLPSDAIYEDNTRNLSAEVVRLAFQSARAEAALIATSEKNTNTNQTAKAPPQQQDLTQIAARIAAEIDNTQSRLDSVNRQLASAPRNKRKELQAERERLQGKLALDKTVQDSVQKMTTFAEESTDSAGEGLEGSINQLARAVPEVFANKAIPKAAAKTDGSSSSLA